MRQKRIVAIILAVTLALGGSLAAGATELDESQSLSDQESEADAIAYYTEGELEESEDEISETGEAAAEIEKIAEDIEITEDDESEQEVELNEDDVVEFDTSDMDVGRFTGMKEIAEIDPDLIQGSGVESDSAIQTYDFHSYSYSYTYTSLSFPSSGGRSADAILDKAVTLINGNEGGYNTVTKNDNNSGAMSLGKIQWWADSALLLVRLIVAEDNQTAYNLLGDSLYNEIIKSSTSWSQRTLNDSEAALMKNFLDPNQNPASKTIQDKLASSYVASYINHGYNLGIRNAAALVYYADIENQYGYTGGSMGAAKACANYAYNIAGSWDTVTLNELHLAAISNVAHNYAARSNVGSYVERRRYSYGQLVSAGWTYCNSGDYTIPYDSNGYAGAAWLQVALNYYQNAGLSVTGNYDDALKNAVKKYQQSVGLSADGLAGRHTSTKLIHDMYYDSMQTYGTAPSVSTIVVTDIVQINGKWTYTVNGAADYTFTGLAKNSAGWWYVEDGVVDFTCNDYVQNSQGWWYVVGGQVQFGYTGVGNFSNSAGWWYVKDGKVDFSANTVAQNDYGWWYVKDGKVDFSANTVAKNSAGWWYIEGGKVIFSYNGFGKNDYGWWYIEEGKVNFSKSSVIQDTNKKIDGTDGWWYVVDGEVQTSYTNVVNYTNNAGWWYVKNGKVDFSANTVAQNNNGWWYVVGGKVQFGYTGVANYSNSAGWWYIKDGKVDFSANTVAQNNAGWWYVVGGKVQFGYTGVANYSNAAGWWYIKDGKVDFSANTVAKNDYGWWYVEDGKVMFSFNGIAKNDYGWWYIKDGKVDFSFTGTVTVNGTEYSVTKGEVAR